MLVINYSHPLTDQHLTQLATLAGEPVERVIDVPAQFNADTPFGQQLADLADATGLSPRQWQTLPILVNPPSYNFGALALFAHLEGLMGHLPSIVRLRPVPDAPV